MKIGDYVVCIENYTNDFYRNKANITIGENYKIIGISINTWCEPNMIISIEIVDDDGWKTSYFPQGFISLEEYREEQINKIIE